MAITIIPSTAQCTSCYSTMTYEPSDVLRVDFQQHDFHIMREEYIICPYCGDRVILGRY
jgi:DNA-directed RNA polymerase subunit RPC12/RpoP